MTPTDRKYTQEHEWVQVKDGVAYIGITDYAQHALGDIVFVELPYVDDEIAAGDSLAVVESVKAVASVYTAAAGKIAETNAALEDQPELLNQAPYDNFIAAVAITELDESKLMDAAAYDAFVASIPEE